MHEGFGDFLTQTLILSLLTYGAFGLNLLIYLFRRVTITKEMRRRKIYRKMYAQHSIFHLTALYCTAPEIINKTMKSFHCAEMRGIQDSTHKYLLAQPTTDW